MNATVSDTIRMARILCILLLVYAHAQPYQSGVPESLVSPMGLIYYLRQLLGHTSVPLLSLISGYLLARTLSARPYFEELGNKFFSLIVPLVLWNLIYIGKAYFESAFAAVPALHEWPNAVLAITSHPAMMPLYFLRDAFVCFLISPALIYVARKMPRTAAAVLLLNALIDVDGVLFINSAIPLFYFAGCVLQVRKVPIPTHSIAGGPVLTAGLAVVLLSAAHFYVPPAWGMPGSESVIFAAVDIALRAAGCVVFWAFASSLLQSRVGGFLLPFEPVAFFIFCAHGIAAGVWWIVMTRMGFSETPPAFVAYFLISPLLVLVTSVAAVWALRTTAPTLLSLLMGGRVPTAKQMKAMLLARDLPIPEKTTHPRHKKTQLPTRNPMRD